MIADVKKPNQTHPEYITYDIACNEDFVSLANSIVEKAETSDHDNIREKMEADVKALVSKLGKNIVIFS